MKKGLKIALIVFFGLLVFIVVGTQLALNSRIVTNTIQSLASEYLDAELGYSKLKVSLWRYFPRVKVRLDDLYLVYPHEKFARYGKMEGSGESVDTLACFKSLSLSAKPWAALSGRIFVEDIHLEGMRAYAHQYTANKANWDVFRAPADSAAQEALADSTSANSAFLRFASLDSLRIDGMRVVYTSRPDSLEAAIDLDELSLSAVAFLDTLRVDRAALGLKSRLAFKTADINLEQAALVLGLSAHQSCAERLDVCIEELDLSSDGIGLQLNGTADDLLGVDPQYELQARLDAVLAEVFKILPSLAQDFNVDGDLCLDLNAKTRQSEIDSYRFDNSVIHGTIASNGLKFNMPADTLDADVFKTLVQLNAEPEGIRVDVAFDSVYFKQGADMAARVRELGAKAQITKVESRGQVVPKISVGASGRRAFVKTGPSRLGVSDLDVEFSAQRKARRMRPDSLSKRPDSLRRSRFMIEQEFEGDQLDISLDSSIVKYFRGWSPAGHIAMGRGFFASPELPLRTRIRGIDADFDERNVQIRKLSVASGSSDISVKGQMKGLWRALTRKSRIEGEVSIESKRLNLNEILAALEQGSSELTPASNSEDDESFVTDSLENVEFEPESMPLIVVPANIKLGVSLRADTVDFASFDITPFTTGIRIQDRTIQLTDTDINSNVGKIFLNAFYSTKSKSDISAGVDLRLNEMPAHDLISLIPSVEDMMPAIKSFYGLMGCEVSGTAKLDTAMNVIMPSVDGLIRITGKDLEVKDVGDLRKITRLLLFKDKNIGKIDDLRVDALIRDNMVEVFPFELAADRYRFALRGTQKLDGSLYYHASVLKSPFLVPFGLNIYGTLDNWRFSLCRAKYRSGKVAVFTQQLDTVQINFAESVHNIFKRGVDNVMQYNASFTRSLELDDPKDTGGPLSDADFAAIDDMMLADQLQAQEDEIMAEVEAALKATAIDSAKLLKDYHKSISDAKIDRKIEKLKRQSDRKKKS